MHGTKNDLNHPDLELAYSMAQNMNWHLDTRLARTGTEPDAETGALAPPIHTASTYARNPDGIPRPFVYSRLGNPTRQRFEEALATSEGGARAMGFASGMTAAMTLCQALDPGDHIILPHDIYFGVRTLIMDHFVRWGLHVSEVDQRDEEAVGQAMQANTRLVWVETPSNPQLNIIDISAIASVAKRAGARLVVDNTWSTPLITRPIDFGADVVLHSVTKYLGGHSDVLGGALVFAREDSFSERVASLSDEGGAVLDPFGSWLVMRGMRSLGPRLRQQSATAVQIAHWLEQHPSIEAVHYPGLSSHPGHSIALRQMAMFGGMMSFRVHGGPARALSVVKRSRLFANATSLGGTESLMEHRASIEGEDSPTPGNLLRMSVGLEHVDDLLADLDTALSG